MNGVSEICIVCLDYSNSWRQFHISNEKENVHKCWVTIAEEIDEIDANKFIDFMENKYVKGRVNGELPILDIVKLELQLFFKLKNVRRKLVGN